MKAFIDDFTLIRIESETYIFDIGIEGYQLYWYKNEDGNQFFKVSKPLELHETDHIWINHQRYPLYIGVVTLLPSFDKKFRYDGPLGYEYSKEETTFYVFSPVAKEMMVVVDGFSYPMHYEKPIWTTTVIGDLEGKSYQNRVRLVDEFELVNDPYNIASTYTSQVIIDKNKTYQQTYPYVHLKRYTDAVIYEGHIRDLTIRLDVIDKGLYDGLARNSMSLGESVLQYIKRLGMTHLQLLPVQDFYEVDDLEKDKQYNWGYNPMQYFALEGWYSKHPNDPYARINEFKKLVDEAHKIGLGINVDVVYNHVYERHLFPYDQLVPGYFYRHDKHHKPTHTTGLSNDVESTRYMVRRLIVDSLVFLMEYYKVDGFRFDLMGLLDIETMLEVEKRLRKINPSTMLYGEGWNMPSAINPKLRSNMENQKQLPTYAFFNDFVRNNLKGALHTKELGYATGSTHHNKEAILSLLGSPHMFTYPTQSLNYVECHDNMTFYDTLDFNYSKPMIKQMYQDLANHMIAIAQGIPFYHAGQEMYRTKFGVENSYNSKDDINAINWYPYSSIAKLRKLLWIRSKYQAYRYHTYTPSMVKASDIDDYLYYELQSKTYSLHHYIKNDFKKTTLPNDGKIIFNSQKLKKQNGFIYADKPGVYIIKRKKEKKL